MGAPRSWLKQAQLAAKGKCDLAVALHLYHWHIVRKSRTISVSNGELAEFGVDRFDKYHALERLEAVGLIKVDRHNKKSLKVTLRKLR
jgi:hypothetical protein